MHSWMAGPLISSPVVSKTPGERPKERPQIGVTAGLGGLRAELHFKEVLIANSPTPRCVAVCFAFITDAEEKTCIADEQSQCHNLCLEEQEGLPLPCFLKWAMRKSTFNILRCIDMMVICVSNLSDYVLVSIITGQDVGRGEAEVKSHYMQGFSL